MKMTIEDFTEMVEQHDMFYEYADDHQAWKKGFNERVDIGQARKELGDEICVPIWNARVSRMHEDIQEIYRWKQKQEGSEMGTMTESYAKVAWKISDILGVMEDWNEGEAISFLLKHEKDIQEAMIQRGWQAIEDLLLYEDIKEKE